MFFIGRRVPVLGIVLGVAFIIWGVAAHSTLREIIGILTALAGARGTIKLVRERRGR
jgi:hypothetical protein